MKKKVIILGGKIINVGDWDDLGDGKPLPEGAVIEEREMEYSEEFGWRELGFTPAPSDEERIAMLEEAIIFLLGGK